MTVALATQSALLSATTLTVFDGAESPLALVARTRKTYVAPALNPSIPAAVVFAGSGSPSGMNVGSPAGRPSMMKPVSLFEVSRHSNTAVSGCTDCPARLEGAAG